MIRTLKIYFSFIFIFVLHRYYSWHFLAEQYGNRNVSLWRELLVGFTSDVWIAGILTLPFWFLEFFAKTKYIRFHRRLGIFSILVVGALTAGHQAYVEFFRFQIIPFHLSYLFDTSFLKSNSSSVLDPAPTIIAIVTAGLAYWTRNANHVISKRIVSAILGITLAIMTISHALNIRWRVNWFVIEPLQTNYLESLYINLTKKPHIKVLSEDDKAEYIRRSGNSDWLTVEPTLLSNNTEGALRTLQGAARGLVKSNKPVIIGVILAESLRSSDVGTRPNKNRSLTTSLDRLRSKGITFNNVYSSGPVTRGGQEAVWCGTPSSTDTSLMRSYPDLAIDCLPKIFRQQGDVVSLWSHGGDERFDSQLMFWSHQGVSRFITKSDFPQTAPSTSWGISDLAVFEKTAKTLQDLTQSKQYRLLLPMILTVTNHIPWALPDDASIETEKFIPKHPAHRTVRYFDESLGLFVASLKEKNLWENSIFVVTGDHGHLEEPWHDDYHNDEFKWERLLSHVSVTLTGGLVERLKSEGLLPDEVDRVSSQTQIAGLIHALATSVEKESKTQPLWDLPLFAESPWVVVSDLNQYLFLPRDGIRLNKEDVLAGAISETEENSWLAAFRYRGWLEYLYSSKRSH
jgi:phosphoglycerol transferase MdoB-like AlkP superfamily enzyme